MDLISETVAFQKVLKTQGGRQFNFQARGYHLMESRKEIQNYEAFLVKYSHYIRKQADSPKQRRQC